MQEYLASQLKPLWILVQSVNDRQRKIEQELDMNNASFVME